jgi:16S rRNA (cytosine967-C5)-methyltransferase
VSDAGRPAMAVRGAVTEARGAAAVLTDLRGGELLDSAFDRRTSRLDPRDRRWTRELVFGMLRRRSWLDALLDDRVRGGLAKLDPDLIDLLRLGAYQLLSMGSVPPYAAIGQTVELTKRRHGIGASKLANAVLRRLDRERDRLVVATPEDPVEALALEHSHPRWLRTRRGDSSRRTTAKRRSWRARITSSVSSSRPCSRVRA